MAGRPLRRARMNPNEYTKAQYPYEVFYQRKVKGKITSGSVPIATREEAEACVRGMKRSPETVEAFIRKRNPRGPSKTSTRAKKAIDKTSQAYQQRQAARGFGGYTKMDPCSACGKRRAVEPCIGIDEGGKCPESSKWVGDAICMQCINVERRKAGLHAVDVYGDPLVSKAKRNPRRLVQNPYKDKILLPSGNIQYVYGEEDVAKRQREKAQRIEGFKAREEALLRAVKRDVAKGDDTALAIGLIMTTYERPGNTESAKDGHYGVTGWECRHLSKEGKSAVALDYVGKSGVQQHKVVSDPALVRALLARQRACKRKGERLLDTSPSSINRYLADYGVRAKDLRTFGANVEMQAELTRLRKAGPRLSSLKPRDLKRTLKAEFMAAVATVAGKMGHTTTMLRRQYLVKEMEPTYIATGRVVKSFA